MAGKAGRAGKARRGYTLSGKNRHRINMDRWTHLESAVRSLEKKQEIKKQHGPVKVIVRNGVPVPQV